MKEYKELILTALMVVGLGAVGMADTGHQGAVRTEKGSYTEPRRVTGSSYTATAMWDASIKRPDGICRVNGDYTIWLGSATDTTRDNVLHPNISEGFPVLSSETFRLGGSMTGSQYFTCDEGVSTCEIRCLDGKVR